MKKIFLLLFTFIYSFSLELSQDFLEPQDAFKSSFTKNQDSLNFKLDLGRDIYLYDDKLKVFISKPEKIEITEDVNIPEPEAYHEFIVLFNNLDLTIPFSLLNSKINSSKYEITVQFQGCSKAGLCYAPMSEKYLLELDGTIVKKELKEVLVQTPVQNTGLNETDTIANSLKDGNILLILATFLVLDFYFL